MRLRRTSWFKNGSRRGEEADFGAHKHFRLVPSAATILATILERTRYRENDPADGFEEPKAMRNGNPLRGSERQCAKIMARVERKREPERSVPRILAIVTSYRRWVVLLHNHSISLLFL